MNLVLIVLALIQPLWPSLDKIPDFRDNQIAAPAQQARKPNFDRSAHRMPYLEWCEAPCATNKKDVCVILISGGSYECTCDGPGFKAFEQRLRAEGITCVYLWYRTPRPTGLPIYKTAWEDGQRAVRLVREQAKERGFDPEKIGVMGCSAGSHLSVLLSTNSQTPAYEKVDATDELPCHINFALVHCPAYLLDDGLAGPNVNKGVGAKLDSIFKFDAKTCPMCLFHGEDDLFSPLASTQLYRQLKKRNIPAELHLDANRGHGVCEIADFERGIEFMRQMGYLGEIPGEITQDHRLLDDGTARTEKEMLWPKGTTPHPVQAYNIYEPRNYEPYLTWYIPEKVTTKAIQVILPGGGYSFCYSTGEGIPVAHYFNRKGMTAVIVRYRCPRQKGLPKYQLAWEDAQRAIRVARSEAVQRGLDPNRIGVIGFSAGGHLTLMCATNGKKSAYDRIDAIDDISAEVQWAFPTYPAYTLTDGVDTWNSTGGIDDEAVIVPEFAFDEATPPMCFSHGDADKYSSMASVKCWERLRQMGIWSDLHTYATRGHCFQIKSSKGTGSCTWMDRLWNFLTKTGLNK